jgi:hypothetical protein
VGFFTIVGLSHTEDVASRATRRVADHDKAAGEHAIANDSAFTVISAPVFDLYGDAVKYGSRVLEVQASIRKSASALREIEGNAHWLL